MNIFKSIDKVLPYLNFAWKRHKVILSNIANADAPNYRAKDLALRRRWQSSPKIGSLTKHT